MPAVLSNWRQAPGTEETTKNYRGRGVDADTDRRVCLSSLAPRAIKGLQWLYHVVRTRYISWRFRRFGPRPISLFRTAVLDQFLLLRHACYLRTGRQDTGPGILIPYTLHGVYRLAMTACTPLLTLSSSHMGNCSRHGGGKNLNKAPNTVLTPNRDCEVPYRTPCRLKLNAMTCRVSASHLCQMIRGLTFTADD